MKNAREKPNLSIFLKLSEHLKHLFNPIKKLHDFYYVKIFGQKGLKDHSRSNTKGSHNNKTK